MKEDESGVTKANRKKRRNGSRAKKGEGGGGRNKMGYFSGVDIDLIASK